MRSTILVADTPATMFLKQKGVAYTEHHVVKTLVMQDEAAKPLMVLMHGYQVGGTSPFGTKKRLPVYLERSVLDLPKIYINGGRRGFLVGIAPGEIVRTLAPRLVDVALEE